MVAAVLFARCGSDGDWCCCCEPGFPWMEETSEPDHDAIEAAAVVYARESAGIRDAVGEVTSVEGRVWELVPMRTVERQRLRVVEIHARGPSGEVTAYVYMLETSGAWSASGLRLRGAGGEWIEEGTIPRQRDDEIAEAAIEQLRASPELAERVGAIEQLEVRRTHYGEPAVRDESGRVGGESYVVTVEVTGAGGRVTLEVWLQRRGGRYHVRAAVGEGLTLGAIPEPEPEETSSGGSGGGFDWD